MSMLTRRNPFNDFRALEARLFEPFFGRFPFVTDEAEGLWAPPIDVVEEKERLLVRAEVPGMDEKDLRVEFEDGLLTIRGERQFERKQEQNYHRIERTYGAFSRSFTLPRGADGANISATYRNGILEVVIPKREEAKPRAIAINGENAKQIAG